MNKNKSHTGKDDPSYKKTEGRGDKRNIKRRGKKNTQEWIDTKRD